MIRISGLPAEIAPTDSCYSFFKSQVTTPDSQYSPVLFGEEEELYLRENSNGKNYCIFHQSPPKAIPPLGFHSPSIVVSRSLHDVSSQLNHDPEETADTKFGVVTSIFIFSKILAMPEHSIIISAKHEHWVVSFTRQCKTIRRSMKGMKEEIPATEQRGPKKDLVKTSRKFSSGVDHKTIWECFKSP
jgi:hypothetical protein